MKARTVFVKVRYKVPGQGRTVFKNFSFQKHLDMHSSMDSVLFGIARSLFMENVLPGEEIRLVGVGVSGLRQNYNLNLFGKDEGDNLFDAVDKIRESYGRDSVKFGV